MSMVGKRDWGMVAAGIALAIVGVIFLMAPGLTLVTLAVVAGAALLAVGVVDTVTYVRYRKERKLTRWALAYALCDMVLGAALLIHPLVSAAVIPWIVGIFLAVAGVFDVVAALRLRGEGEIVLIEETPGGVEFAEDSSAGWGWVLFGGLLSVAVALTFFFLPETFALFLSFYLMVRGIMLAVYGFSMKYSMVEVGAQ